MRKYLTLIAAAALFVGQQSFAQMTDVQKDPDEGMLKQCENIASACKTAGFTRDGGPGKGFWMDCMKPILMGKSVTGVTVDPNDVKSCKQFKIKMLEKKLEKLKASQ